MGVVLASGCPLAGDPTATVSPHFAIEPLPVHEEGPAAARLAVATLAEPVIVVVRPEHREATRRAVLESFAEPAAIVMLPVSLTQLGARLLTLLLAAVERHAGISCAAELGPDLARLIDARVLISSVTALDDPAPSVRQHARSWTPGAIFQVTSGRARAVHTGVKPAPIRGSDQAIVAQSPRAPAALIEAAKAVAAGAVSAPAELPAWPEVTNASASHWAEMVLWSADEVGYLINSRAAGLYLPCRWCGRAISEPVCVFCGADSRVASVLEAEEPAR